MLLTECELWLLNLYRNSELHGALLMGRLARSVRNPEVLVGATRHCATEAEHAALLSEVIAKLGGTIDCTVDTIQKHYSEDGGIPKDLVDLLVLSEVLEARVLLSYREHLERSDIHPLVRETLELILQEEQAHSGREGWAEKMLAKMPRDKVSAAREKWSAVDQKVAEDLHARLTTKLDPRGAKQ
jgi:hypothetical protein